MSPDVLHLGDIAGTSKVFVEVARGKGLDWGFRDVPVGRNRAAWRIVADRLVDLMQVRTLKPRPRILHINYGVSGYYGWGRKNVVLHLHGTDVRQDLNSRFLGPVVRRSVLTADRVLYSTPDLADTVLALRPDAIWMPAPLTVELSGPQEDATFRRPDGPPRIFFASRWDESKGAVELIDAARRLRTSHPEAELLGIAWGTHEEAAREAGVTLLPHLSQEEFLEQLRIADVVVGQVAFGVLGLADLQALALGKPLVARFTMQDHYGGEPPLESADSADGVVDAVDRILGSDPEELAQRGAAARSWALEHHGAFTLEARLEDIYGTL